MFIQVNSLLEIAYAYSGQSEDLEFGQHIAMPQPTQRVRSTF
jgi:hypothetical protein